MNTVLTADSDLMQVIMVVVFLVVGFIQWLIKLFQEKKEQAKRSQQPPRTQAEIEALRQARLEELQEQRRRRLEGHPPTLPPNMPKAPPLPPMGGPMGELFESWSKATEATPPSLPPPPEYIPSQRAPDWASPMARSHSSTSHTRQESPVATEDQAPAASSRGSAMTLEHHLERQAHVTTQADAAYNEKVSRKHSLAVYLRSAEGYRQAFVLREVLGPPKALQKEADWVY